MAKYPDPSQVLPFYEKKFGIFLGNDAKVFIEPEWRNDDDLAMDALPSLVSSPSAGIPAFLLTSVDPEILQVLTAPTEATTILPEERKGQWQDRTWVFPVVEHTGNVSSYDDYGDDGVSEVNPTFPQRQSYLAQTVLKYGDLELDIAAAAKLNYAAEKKTSAVINLNNFVNLSYFRGVLGLKNYGMQNDPNLLPIVAPALKAWGGNGWYNGSSLAATANEIFADIQALITLVIQQANGNIKEKDPMILALSPQRSMGLTATNSFGVNVYDLIKKNFPNLTVVTAPQYGAVTGTNPQGMAAGEFMQLFVPDVKRQKTGLTSYNEKLRAHPMIRRLSSVVQKLTSGTWGSIIRQPFAVSGMIGI